MYPRNIHYNYVISRWFLGLKLAWGEALVRCILLSLGFLAIVGLGSLFIVFARVSVGTHSSYAAFIAHLVKVCSFFSVASVLMAFLLKGKGFVFSGLILLLLTFITEIISSFHNHMHLSLISIVGSFASVALGLGAGSFAILLADTSQMGKMQFIQRQAVTWFVRFHREPTENFDWKGLDTWIRQSQLHRDAYNFLESLWYTPEDLPQANTRDLKTTIGGLKISNPFRRSSLSKALSKTRWIAER